ncbi:hypothetical protein [Xanthomonas albilineans]|uniref:hypothetical protein n=1 Tax=Xanthomonas albilineans TaxID=29447 RepID=UPI0012D4904A|nr:hypothetical protein [Xanthomonas albilineans]
MISCRAKKFILYATFLSAYLYANIGLAMTKEEAYNQCSSSAAQHQPSSDNLVTSPGVCIEQSDGQGFPYYRCQYQATYPQSSPVTLSCGDFGYDNSKPPEKNCSAQPVLNSGWSSLGNGASCQDGCAYGPATSAETQTAGGMTYYSMAGAAPTGKSCTMGDGTGSGLTKDDCVKQGNLTQCMQPDGRLCAVSSSGKKFCWSATEAGTKVDGNEGATKSPVGANINPPNSKPPNGGDWEQSGWGTSSSSSGGTTNNDNVTTWQSSYGSQGSGSGSGDGDGDDKGDGNDPAGKGVGDLYKPSGNTVDSVFSDFKSQIQGAPIFQSATSFLGGCSGGGQCPNETWDGGQYAGKFDLSQFCSGTLGSLMGFAGYVFLAAMSAVGFRWALL